MNKVAASRRRSMGLLVALCAFAFVPSATISVAAAEYPSRTITMIVPFPPGGPSDTVARIVADGMSRHLGTTIIIENIGGAGGTIGAAKAVEAAPDGYTLLAASMGTIVAAPSLYPHLRYDSVKDFVPIGMTADMPAAVVVRPDLPVKTLREFVDYVKQHGMAVKQAHGGIGSSSHMACLLFNNIFDLKPTAIAYRGTAPALTDLMGGHVDYYCDQVVSVAPAARANKVRALVVSANQRDPALPDVPDAQEAGAPEYQLNVWNAVYATKGTPQDVVAKLAKALDQALDDPETGKKLGNLGASVPPKAERGPEVAQKTVTADIPRWAPILRAAMQSANAN